MNTNLTFHYPHPPTSEEAITDFEKDLGVRLPEDYRQFLLKYNGGGLPNRSCFRYVVPNWKETGSAVSWFDGLQLETHAKLRVRGGLDDQPDYLLLIGSALSTLLGIGIKDDTFGKVYVWEHTIGDDIILLADSFNEFLAMLYDAEG